MRRILIISAAVLAVGGSSLAAGAERHGTLVVGERALPGPNFTEGAFSFLRVTRVGGPVIVDARMFATRPWRGALVPGRYRITSWQRPCEGNCGVLDPPTGRCTATVRVRPAAQRRLTVLRRAGDPCRVRG